MNSFQIIFMPTSGSSLLVSQSSYNNVNQLASRSGTGSLPVRFLGTVNKYSTVTVTNQSAALLDTNFTFTFGATVSLPVGTRTVPVMAVDVNGNIASNNYAVTVVGDLGKTYRYDPDGNCTNVSMTDTNISYEWDAQSRLHAINIYFTNTSTLQRSEFSYDGSDRRSQIIEKINGSVVGTKRFVWCGSQLCQERDGSDAVTKRFFDEGEQIAGDNYYYLRDRLGSIQQMIDSDGYIRADYDYDPYGNQTKVQGDLDADFGFAGYYLHAPSGLYLTWYRAYDADSGRWLNRDPIEENGGLNLYGYVFNNPLNFIDPSGYGALPSGWGTYIPPPPGGLGQQTLDPNEPIGPPGPSGLAGWPDAMMWALENIEAQICIHNRGIGEASAASQTPIGQQALWLINDDTGEAVPFGPADAYLSAKPLWPMMVTGTMPPPPPPPTYLSIPPAPAIPTLNAGDSQSNVNRNW